MNSNEFHKLELPLTLLEATGDPLLAGLRERLPRSTGELAAAGEAAPPQTAPADDEGDQLAAETWAAALRTGKTAAGNTIPRLRRQLKLADAMQLVSAIVAAVAGTTLIGLIAGDGSKTANIIIASLTLVSTIVTLVSGFLRQRVGGGDRVELLAMLLKDIGEAMAIAMELEIWARRSPPRPPLDPELLKRAKELVISITTSLGRL